MLCVKPQMVSNRFENLHPNSEDEEDGEKGEGNDDLSHYCRYFCPFPPVQNWFILKLKSFNILLILGRVWRDPGTRPVPIFFSSTRPVPARKLKMTGYRVIQFHFESNKTQLRMRDPAYEVTNPINPSTENHFLVNYWGKWTRTGAVISS